MDDQQLIQALEQHGGSWKDFFLVGDPPAISRWSPHGNLYGLVIEDNDLYHECIEFLRRREARHFPSPDEATRAFRPPPDAKK